MVGSSRLMASARAWRSRSATTAAVWRWERVRSPCCNLGNPIKATMVVIVTTTKASIRVVPAWDGRRDRLSPVSDIGRLAGSAFGLVGSECVDIDFAVFAGVAIKVGRSPRVVQGGRFLKIRTVPTGGGGRRGDHGAQPLLLGGET